MGNGVAGEFFRLVGWLMVMLMFEIEDELRFGSEIP